MDNYRHYEGFDIVPFTKMELIDEEAYPSNVRVKKKMTIGEFMAAWAKDKDLSPLSVRPWSMVGRQNGTVRPDATLDDPNMTIEDAAVRYGYKHVLRLWIEDGVAAGDGTYKFGKDEVALHKTGDKPILLFLKMFDVETQKLYGVGCFYASNGDKVVDLGPTILKLLGWSTGTNYRVFEEIKQGMIDSLKAKATLAQAELQDGDIVAVQKHTSEKETAEVVGKFSDLREHYDHLLNRIRVHFYPKNGVTTDRQQFDLVLNKRINYTQLTQNVGTHLDSDPTHLRFSPVNAANGKPKAPIKHSTTYNLGQMLNQNYSMYGTASQRTDALYYEVLECPLTELENRKFVKLTYLPATDEHDKPEVIEVLVLKNGTVTDVVDQLRSKLTIKPEDVNRIRIYEVHNKKLHKDLPLTYAVTNFNEYAEIIAEPRLQEEIDGGEGTALISCFHFDREISKSFGYPFVFLIKQVSVLVHRETS
jgi:ubiquitin carboxyl-terminal hydrolase 7